MSEDIKPTEGDERKPLSPTDGDVLEDDSDDLSDVSEDDSTKDSGGDEEELSDEDKELALKAINKASGQNFKSLEMAAKSLHHAEVVAAEKGKQKKAEQPSSPPKPTQEVSNEVIEELLLTRFPDAEQVLKSDKLRKELETIAKANGTSILKVYRESRYFQSEAKALADDAKARQEASKKVKAPSTTTGPTTKDVGSVKPEEVSKLSPAEKVEWIKAQAKREAVQE